MSSPSAAPTRGPSSQPFSPEGRRVISLMRLCFSFVFSEQRDPVGVPIAEIGDLCRALFGTDPV